MLKHYLISLGRSGGSVIATWAPKVKVGSPKNEILAGWLMSFAIASLGRDTTNLAKVFDIKGDLNAVKSAQADGIAEAKKSLQDTATKLATDVKNQLDAQSKMFDAAKDGARTAWLTVCTMPHVCVCQSHACFPLPLVSCPTPTPTSTHTPLLDLLFACPRI